MACLNAYNQFLTIHKKNKERTYPKCFKTGPPVMRMNWYLVPYTYAVSIIDLCSKVIQSAETTQLIWLVVLGQSVDKTICISIRSHQLTQYNPWVINQSLITLARSFLALTPQSPTFNLARLRITTFSPFWYLVFPDCWRNPEQCPSSLWLPSPWLGGRSLCGRTWPLHAEWHWRIKTERKRCGFFKGQVDLRG